MSDVWTDGQDQQNAWMKFQLMVGNDENGCMDGWGFTI